MGNRRSSIPGPRRSATEAPPVISGRWLLIAFLITIAAALLCVYLTMCLLFYQGQWQMLFQPSRTVVTTPAGAGLAWNEVHFDVTETGAPRMDGWWVPVDPGARYATDTVLYLHDGHGSLEGTVPALAHLHSVGINVFAIDYEGFGKSAGRHPTERLARADAVAAWTWLADIRKIPPGHIVVFGDGIGATFAAALGAEFAPAGVVLEDPNPPARLIFERDARARILPLWLLQNEWLDPTADLERAHGPRLFLDRRGDAARTRELFEKSSMPKEYFDLRRATEQQMDEVLKRFLDEVLHAQGIRP